MLKDETDIMALKLAEVIGIQGVDVDIKKDDCPSIRTLQNPTQFKRVILPEPDFPTTDTVTPF